MSRLETVLEVDAALAEERARLAGYLADLRRRRAAGLDAGAAEDLARAARARVAFLREHRGWLLARGGEKAR